MVCPNPSKNLKFHFIDLFYSYTLTREEKHACIEAEKSLMPTRAKLGLKGARTRFDEFQKLHVLNTEIVH